MIRVPIKQERENFIEPEKATEGASCYDVWVSKIEHKKNNYVIAYLGFSSEIPEGWAAELKPRSGLTKTNWIMQNSPGEIDDDYRGEWQMRFKALPTGICPITNQLMYDEFPFKKLSAGRVDAVYSNRLAGKALIAKLGLTNINYYQKHLDVKYYIGLSKVNTKPNLAADYMNTISYMLDEGIIDNILSSYTVFRETGSREY